VILVVMGVSGSGKSTVGELLAKRLGWPFLDADEYHPPANVAKMKAGTPLTDEDRWPWLEKLNQLLRQKQDAVLACSALKEIYRQRLTTGLEAKIIFLKGDKSLIQERLATRQHKYMPASLLDSQFATLEPPADAIAVDIAQDPGACVEAIVARLG
jgi:carbohydrate kinase (thermoresistant glucokinase family)